MIYAKAFFDLQLQFAHKVVDLSGLPLKGALLGYTNLYVRFGLGRDFDPAHPTWREYLAGLHGTNDDREWTYRFYLNLCFPFQVLSVEASVLEFHDFYGIPSP